MEIPKEMILTMVERRRGGEQAQEAARQLPDFVDDQEHGGLLSEFGIDPGELAEKFGGAGGGLSDPAGGGDSGESM